VTDDLSRVLAADLVDDAEVAVERTLRPRTLDEYIGQREIKANLSVLLAAARGREEAADHVLLYGPPGLGKTTLASIVARELGVNIRYTSGPAIERAGDLAAILTALDERDVLFIDEIHRLNRAVEEILYPAMEDYALDVLIGRARRRARCGSASSRSPSWARRRARGESAHRCATGSARRTGSTSTATTSSSRSSSDPLASSASRSIRRRRARSPVAVAARRASSTGC
jgi:hypothetical protein